MIPTKLPLWEWMEGSFVSNENLSSASYRTGQLGNYSYLNRKVFVCKLSLFYVPLTSIENVASYFVMQNIS